MSLTGTVLENQTNADLRHGLQFHQANGRRAVASHTRRGRDVFPRVRPCHAHVVRQSRLRHVWVIISL